LRVQSEPGKPGKRANFQKSQGACLKICTGQGKVFYDCKKVLLTAVTIPFQNKG